VRRKTVHFLVLAALGSLALASCGDQSALSLAREACVHVHRSIHEYDTAIHAKSNAQKVRDLKAATIDLQKAEPLAASATSADGRWNALMTTLSEFGQVDEGHLIQALQAQCAVADNNQSGIQGLAHLMPIGSRHLRYPNIVTSLVIGTQRAGPGALS
jgi:hypothetical protein